MIDVSLCLVFLLSINLTILPASILFLYIIFVYVYAVVSNKKKVINNSASCRLIIIMRYNLKFDSNNRLYRDGIVMHKGCFRDPFRLLGSSTHEWRSVIHSVAVVGFRI